MTTLAALAVATPIAAQPAPAPPPGSAAPAAAAAMATTAPTDVAAWAGHTVLEVAVIIAGEPTVEPRWVSLVETPPGAQLSLVDLRTTLRHFFNTGMFAGAEAAIEPVGTAGGIRVTYRLIPTHVVSELAFRGDLGLDGGALRRLVVDRFGAQPAPARADAAAEHLAMQLAARGFVQARVTTALETDPGGRTTLRFDVAAGRRARVGKVSIDSEGVPAKLLGEIHVASNVIYDGPDVERQLDEVRTRLRRDGHYEASALVRATPAGTSPAGDPVIDVVITITPGPLVTLRWEGDPIPDARRPELVPVAREASVDEDLLEDSLRRILQFLKQQGHWRAEAGYRRDASPGGLAVTFTVKAGEVFRLGRVEVDGAQALTRADIATVLPAVPGEVFVESTVDSQIVALRERYRRAGYRDVRIEVTMEERDAAATAARPGRGGLVDVRLFVAEGALVRVGAVRLAGVSGVSEADLRAKLKLAPGAPFYEPLIATDRDALSEVLFDRGYDRARVVSTVTPVTGQPAVDIAYDVAQGTLVRVGRILVVGNRRTATDTIVRALTLKPGDPLGLAEVFESQRRLRALGLFRRVTITDVGEGGEAQRDLVVTVEEAAPTSIGYGAGIEVGRYLRQETPGGQASERLELAGRGFFEVGRQNLWGSNRSLNLFTRVSLRPSGVAQAGGGSDFGFNEYRFLLSFRDPSVFDVADTRITGYFEQAVRSSFNFVRRGVLAEGARRFKDRITLVGSYSLSTVRLFDERIAPEDRPDIDRLFPQVRISKFQGALRRDTRDDLLDPTKGLVIGLDGDLAARALASQVGFVKGYGEVFAYRTVSSRRRIILAGGVRVGLAKGFERDAARVSDAGSVVVGPDGQAIIDVVTDLPASERFFTGGDTSVRGFARDSLGDVGTLDPNGFPTGGHAVTVINAELRTPLWRELGGVVFVDAGNVFRRAADLDLGALRASAGFGFRYKSPVGPVRVDFGFRLGSRRGVPDESEPSYAIHFSIGQAF
ncbi:MAG: BamA/TamA family outer membrane protein [Vicinamibacteraceae bacterium]